jgi:hypothetical protein
MIPRNASEVRAAVLACRYTSSNTAKPCVERINISPSQRFYSGGELVVAFSRNSDGIIDGHFVDSGIER